MTDHQWLSLLSALVSATLICLGIVIRMLSSLKDEFSAEIAEIRKELQQAISKVDETAREMARNSKLEHAELWDRLLHHSHNAEGQVVIPKQG